MCTDEVTALAQQSAEGNFSSVLTTFSAASPADAASDPLAYGQATVSECLRQTAKVGPIGLVGISIPQEQHVKA